MTNLSQVIIMHQIDFVFKIVILRVLTILDFVNQIDSDSPPIVLWHGMGKTY